MPRPVLRATKVDGELLEESDASADQGAWAAHPINQVAPLHVAAFSFCSDHNPAAHNFANMRGGPTTRGNKKDTGA